MTSSNETPSKQPQSDDSIIYFVDGYHGGIKGHMAPGVWRDVLAFMRRTPEWKFSVDIEPISWTYLRRRDPRAYREFVAQMQDNGLAPRIEMVAASYAQPYGWVIGGESNIRHLIRGREVLREHFPNLLIDTYAVQEPCWTSSMPQILLSLGFVRAVLKDPGTAWSGYSAGFDADVVNWVGPDGSSIPTVPRYACEGLQKCYETEAATSTVEWGQKCREHGIKKPAGMYYQDSGWPAKRQVVGDHIRYVTWREYMEKIAPKPEQDWHLTQEDILGALPWGETTLTQLARHVRSAENRLPVTEKMAAMAAVFARMAWPGQKLQEAWDQTLLAQHHDAWACARSRGGRHNWAWLGGAQTWMTEEFCDAIVADATELMTAGDIADLDARDYHAYVFNTLGSVRNDVVEVFVTADAGTRSVHVFDAAGAETPAQLVTTRKYRDDESINAARLLFRADVPSLGYQRYRVEFDKKDPSTTGAHATTEDGSVVIESDIYRIVLDTKRGGVFTSLFAKDLNKEFVDPGAERLFNEYRGYFIEEKQFFSSADSPAEVSIVENGPVRVRLLIKGSVASNPFWSTVTICQGQRRIDVQGTFLFPKDTWIGDPVEVSPEERRLNRVRSQHDSRYGLQAFFPTSLGEESVDKNAAYDVCRSRYDNTFYKSWDEIKNNIILNWVDVVDREERFGLTLMSDHTGTYSHGKDHPLALVMVWGWEGGYWWGRCPARGHQEMAYSLIPHAGRWDAARISEECARWSEPLLSKVQEGGLAAGAVAEKSLVAVSGTGVEVPTAMVDGNDLLVRLFNAEGDGETRTVSVAGKPSRVEAVELDGRPIGPMDFAQKGDRCEVSLAFPRFGLRTIRFCGVA